MNQGILQELQDECAGYLASQPYFSAQPIIPIVAEREREIESAIQVALTKIGVGVVLFMPQAERVSENIFPPYFEEIRVTARVYENVLINRSSPSGTLQPVTKVAEALAFYLHHFRPQNMHECLVLQSIRHAPEESFALAYDVELSMQAGISSEPQRT